MREPNPYAPPQSPAWRPPNDASGVDLAIERPVRSTARLGMVMLAVIGLGVVLGWTLNAMMLVYVARLEVADAVWKADLPTFRVYQLLRSLGIVLFLVWIYRAARDVRALRPKFKVMSPAMCVASFFIPVANLFLPYKSIFEIAAGSDTGGEGRVPIFVLAWWPLFLGSWIASYARFTAMQGTAVWPKYASSIAEDGLTAAAFVTLVLAVRFITRGQEHWARQARKA